ncbi:hypothetical protein [Desulforhopalus sp. IMCC35007]|uniref:hypothetical protein n=1 Tax=Desulforhopalus sp. IMCC35007 TaxID=2569543 RepID=UPI0010AE3609|nr:hypothetical protein [Desulforhopalus sp. IMCC35007]TKB10746.1 hypothetical protein FCL48_05815 [Desulforhopalus sp. IMCC35007]
MKKYTGAMIVATLVSYLISEFYPSLRIVTATLAWAVPLLMWRSLGKSALQQALLLLSIGFIAVLFSASKGVYLGWQQIFAVNLPLLAMFVAVAFLTLTNHAIEDPTLPKGNLAVVTTALGTHFLGAVINLSILFVFGDRLQKNGTLTREQMFVLARSFSAAAWWSPFFIATGVALTYAPDMAWKETLVPGILMSGLAIGYSVVEVSCIRKKEFSGYPIRFESLLVPMFLAGVVVCVHHFWHGINILNLICVVAPLGAFLFMKGRPRRAALLDFVGKKILSVNSQFVLFLAAGVFSSGLKSLTYVYPEFFSLDAVEFSPLLFTVVLCGMIVVGFMGVHPLVSIAIVSPLLLPLHPDHSRLAFLFLCSWAVSTGSSPLSGVGLAMVSRYHASPRQIIRSNYHYVIVMWLAASLVNVLYFG